VRCSTSKFLCADISFSFQKFYFSIQTNPYPRWQAGRQFERRPCFLANSLSLRQMTNSPGSSSPHNDWSYKSRIYAPSLLLCLFILVHCLDPHHVDNKTDIDQSVLFCRHTFNGHSSSPHSPSQSNTCHWHPRRPYCKQQAPRLTFCTHLTIIMIKRTSSLELALPARFWPSGDLLSQTILARSFTVLLFFGQLQHGLT